MSLPESKSKEVLVQALRRFSSELSPDELSALEREIAQIDFDALAKLAGSEEQSIDWAACASRSEPPPAVRLGEESSLGSFEQARASGEKALRSGKVGAVLVAGGQGTRLGFDQPKGMFPIGPISNRTLFQMHCDRLLAVMRRYDVSIPLFVMTSPATDAATRAYFAEHENCGLAPDQLTIFCQGTMPAVDAETGEVLLSEKHRIALSPDGHGGLVSALDKSDCLNKAAEAGIEYLFYAQVDNPLVELCSPELIGYHLLSQSQLTTQVVQKRFGKEKVGNVVLLDGKVQIIEYSDLPDEIAEQQNPDGSLRLWAGNIAVHVFDLAFLRSVVGDMEALPFHRAHKKVPYVGADGRLVEPEEPNAIKFERFVFDLLPLAERAIVVEGDPQKVFAPVKNAEGAAVDTASQSRAAQVALHRSWLVSAGAKVEENVQIEIHPVWALDAMEAAGKVQSGVEFVTDTYLR